MLYISKAAGRIGKNRETLKMAEGRKERTIKNLVFVMLLMNIVVRAIFVRALSKEYLGLSGLFNNIIALLSLTELGIGTAIVYSLYEPLAYKQEDKIYSLMRFYQRVYFAIGMVILAVGVVLTPFLNLFIQEMPDIPEITQIYLLFVLNAASSYCFSYKSSLISADQGLCGKAGKAAHYFGDVFISDWCFVYYKKLHSVFMDTDCSYCCSKLNLYADCRSHVSIYKGEEAIEITRRNFEGDF